MGRTHYIIHYCAYEPYTRVPAHINLFTTCAYEPYKPSCLVASTRSPLQSAQHVCALRWHHQCCLTKGTHQHHQPCVRMHTVACTAVTAVQTLPVPKARRPHPTEQNNAQHGFLPSLQVVICNIIVAGIHFSVAHMLPTDSGMPVAYTTCAIHQPNQLINVFDTMHPCLLCLSKPSEDGASDCRMATGDPA